MKKTRAENNRIQIGERKKNAFVASLLFYPILIFLVFWVGTNINSIFLAFRTIEITQQGWVYDWTLIGNFKLFISSLLTDGDIIKLAMTNSIKFYLITFIVCTPLNIIFSYLLFKKCMFNKVIRFIVLMPNIVSGFIFALLFRNIISYNGPFSTLYSSLGLPFPDFLFDSNYAFSSMIFFSIWLSFSASLIIYPNAMKEIPEEVIESAQIDGVKTMWHELWYIVLPLIYPTLSMFIITGFSGILLAGGPLLEFYRYDAPNSVYSMGYWFIRQTMVAGEISYPIMAAGGLIMTAVLTPLTLLLKYILEKYGPKAEY